MPMCFINEIWYSYSSFKRVYASLLQLHSRKKQFVLQMLVEFMISRNLHFKDI